MLKEIKIANPASAIKLSIEEANFLGIDYIKDQISGDMKTIGPWNIPVSYKALCVSAVYGTKEGGFMTECIEKTIYVGNRTMTNVRQSGYELEGRVSVNGKKYTCFTSSQLFEINGHLVDVAVIHARIK